MDAFKSSVKSTGMLNETTLYLRTMGLTTVRDFDLILKMAVRGKAPPLLGKTIPKINEVRAVFKLAERSAGQK